jgi:hypothetical protein
MYVIVGKRSESTTRKKKHMLPMTVGLVTIAVKGYVLEFYF